jgi:hypothetical protein
VPGVAGDVLGLHVVRGTAHPGFFLVDKGHLVIKL